MQNERFNPHLLRI